MIPVPLKTVYVSCINRLLNESLELKAQAAQKSALLLFIIHFDKLAHNHSCRRLGLNLLL